MADKELNQRADSLRNEDKETLIGIILAHELEALEVSEIAFVDMYEGRVPFTRADIIDRLREFEVKAYYFDNCMDLMSWGATSVHAYLAMLIRTDTSDGIEDMHLPIG